MMTFGAAIGGRGIWPFFFPLIVVVAVSIYWYYVRLKKVTVEADGLVISNFLREIRVPWRDIVQDFREPLGEYAADHGDV